MWASLFLGGVIGHKESAVLKFTEADALANLRLRWN